MTSEPQILVNPAVWRFIIALLLGGNTGLLGILIRFIFKNYRKYKNAIMVGIEEHEKLVEDYNRRHPEEKYGSHDYLDQFTRPPRTRKRPENFRRNPPSSNPDEPE